MSRFAVFLLATTVVACAGTTPAATTTVAPARAAVSDAPVTGRYVLLRGGDTLGVERFTRTSTRLDAELMRAGQRLFGFGATLGPDATVVSLELMTGPATATATSGAAWRLSFSGDTAVVVQGAGDVGAVDRRADAAGAIPYVNPSPSLMEQIVRRAYALRRSPSVAAQASTPVRVIAAAAMATATVTPIGPDSAALEIGAVTLRFRTDESGAILGGTVPSQGLTIVRVP